MKKVVVVNPAKLEETKKAMAEDGGEKMYTEEQKKEIERLEVLKGACCTSNNLQNALQGMPADIIPDGNEKKFIVWWFAECSNRMQPLEDIPEIAVARRELSNFIGHKLPDATCGEMQEAVYAAHIVIDKEYYKHYADRMGIVENPRK